MNKRVNHIPKNWKPRNFNSFINWFKNHVKSKQEITEDFRIIRSDYWV